MNKFLAGNDFFNRVTEAVSDLEFVKGTGVVIRDEIMDQYLEIFGSFNRLVLMGYVTNMSNVVSRYENRMSVVVDVRHDKFVLSVVRTSVLRSEDNYLDDVELTYWAALPRANVFVELGSFEEVMGEWSDEMIDRVSDFVSRFVSDMVVCNGVRV